MWLVDLGETRQADAWIVADRDKDKETASHNDETADQHQLERSFVCSERGYYRAMVLGFDKGLNSRAI
jgi:hypothetical protein